MTLIISEVSGMARFVTEEEAYQMWLDSGYEDFIPFKGKSWEYDFIDELKDRGIVVEGEITAEQMERYHEYESALKKYEDINGSINEGQIVPLEIQQMNPFN